MSRDGIVYRAFLVTLPLRRPIPVGAQTWSSRPVVLVRGEDAEGRSAWGEAAPLDGYGPDTMEEVLSALSRAQWPEQPMPPSLACAVGTVHWGLNASVDDPADRDDADRLESLEPAVLLDSRQQVPDGASHVKIKVGRQHVKKDIDRILKVHAAHPDVRIRLDGNGLGSRETTMRLIRGLGASRDVIEYVEEPWSGCFRENLGGKFDVPMAIDESLEGDNWLHADVCIIKPSLMGDPLQTLRLARRIQDAGRRVVVSSAFESRVGMTMVTWLAALLGDAAPGIGTYQFVADDWGGRSSLWDASTLLVDRIPFPPSPPNGFDPNGAFQPISVAGLHVEELR